MFAKLFKPVKIGGATFLVTITILFSNILGLLRDRIIATHFGTSSETDVYNASFLIPDTLFNLFISGALAAAFVPIFTEYLGKDKAEARKIANTLLNSAMLVIGLLSIVALIFMHQIIGFTFPQATQEMQLQIVSMTRLMLSSALIFTISNSIGNILMCYKHFFAYSISPLLYNFGIILGVIFLQEKIGIYSAVVGVIGGGILHCAIRLIDIRTTEYKYKFEMDLKHPGFIKIIKLMIPRAIGIIATQFNIFLFTSVGIGLAVGGVAAFNFARNIQSVAVTLFGMAFSTAIFPYLTSAISKGDKTDFTDQIQKTIQRILFFTIPSMVGIMLLSTTSIDLILSGGEFNQKSIDLTALILFYFAASIPLESLSHILSRAFYAVKDTKTPMFIYLGTTAITAFCTIYLAPKYGIEWFSIGFTLGYLFYVIANTILLKKHLIGFQRKKFFISLLKITISSGIMAIAIMAAEPLKNILPSKIADVSIITIGASIFFAASYLLKCEEIHSIKFIMAKLTKKPIENIEASKN